MFNEIDCNIVGVDWEVKIQDLESHMPQLNNNQYASLAGDEDGNKKGHDQENDTESIGVENDGEIT